MTVEEEIAMQEQVNAHHRALTGEERCRRYLLMTKANHLVDRLMKRLITFYRLDPVQKDRTAQTLGRALKRAERLLEV
jgi:hypothetical protein